VHGLIRDGEGVIWFNAWMPKGGLAKVDPKTEKVAVYMPPEGMSHIDGPVTLDYDSKGGIWAGTNEARCGSIRWRKVHRVQVREPAGTERRGRPDLRHRRRQGRQRLLVADGVRHHRQGQSRDRRDHRIEAAARQGRDGARDGGRQRFYAAYGPRDIGTPFPWSQGPRRMGIDRERGIIWVANSWSGTLGRVDAKTLQTTLIPLPNTFTNQPYAAIPDKHQNV